MMVVGELEVVAVELANHNMLTVLGMVMQARLHQRSKQLFRSLAELHHLVALANSLVAC